MTLEIYSANGETLTLKYNVIYMYSIDLENLCSLCFAYCAKRIPSVKHLRTN